MPDILKPDICVIGAGSGGLSVAAAAALFGVPVVLIERGRMGGDCLNVGCVPSKALIAAAAQAAAIRTSARFGIMAGAPEVDFARVMAHVREVIGAIAPNDSVQRFTALGVKVLAGEATFLDRRTVRVGDTEVQARRFVIATGSRPALPDIAGLDGVPFLTNETVFELTEQPAHLIVIGGGPIGCELGQAFARLGSTVTLLQSGSVLPRDEPEAAGFVRRSLIGDGVTLIEEARVDQVSGTGGAVSVRLADGRVIAGSHLLVATGRTPALDALNLAAAGITPDANGIPVNASLRSANSRVYAIGDCASGAGAGGGFRFTHVANLHAGLVIRNALFRLPGRLDTGAIPRVTYTDPEVASIGLTEADATQRGHKVRVLRWPLSENDRAQAMRHSEGLVRLVLDAKGRLLGVSIIGHGAGELLNPWALALGKRLKLADLGSITVAYPTLSEASKRAALSNFAPLAGKPWIRRIIGVLRMLG